ncbi:MAG: hypothetical protein VCC01_09865 [Candidatus Hydrogenedentota bacterium]
MNGWIGFGLAGAFFALIYYCAWRLKKERLAQFERIAAKLGWTFYPNGDGALLERLRVFDLFQVGHHDFIRKLMTAQYGDEHRSATNLASPRPKK